MSHFSDSRDPNGLGFLILQDHGFRAKGQPDYARGALVGVRVVGRFTETSEYGQWEEDPYARGPIGGGHFWPRAKTNVGAYRFIWPAVKATYGETTDDENSAVGGGGEFEGATGGTTNISAGREVGWDWYYPDGTPIWENVYRDASTGKVEGVTGDKLAYIAANVAANGAGKAGGNVNIGGGPGGWGGGGNVGGGIGIVGVGGNVNQVGLPGPWKFGLPIGGGVIGFGVQPAYWKINPDPGGNPVNVLAQQGAAGPAGAPGQQGDAADNAVKAWYSQTEPTIDDTTYPVDSNRLPDRRFKSLRDVPPIGWPQFPRGYFGLVLPSSVDHEQRDQFYPADPRLVAANYAGPASCGTPVADLGGPNVSLSLGRHAPLQSLVRVIRNPTGDRGMLDQNAKSDSPRQWLARQIGPSGQWDVCGGLVMDIPTGKNGTIARGARILAMESVIYGGPLDVGHYGDAHQIGVDEDGNPINSLHLSTDALFKRRGDVFRDFPLFFEDYYPEVGELAFPVAVHLAPDIAGGFWKWWTTSAIKPTTPTITPERPPGEETPPEGPPGETTDPPREPVEEPDRVQPGRGNDGVSVLPVGAVQEIAVPSIAYRPQWMEEGAVDLRYTSRPRMDATILHEQTAPITLREEAFGAQGGPGTPYLSGRSMWAYTQEPGRSRAPGGTANGGKIYLPPEVDMADIDSDFAPAGVTRSQSYVMAAPGVSFAVGLPELSGGGIRSGWTFGVEDTDEAHFIQYDSGGSPATDPTLRLYDDGLEVWPGLSVRGQVTVSPPTPGDPPFILSANATGNVANLNADKLDGYDASAFEPVDATILREADVDDTPVNGASTVPVSSNWAFDHVAAADPHSVYPLDSEVLKKDGTVALTANWDAGSFQVRAETFQSDVAAGTPPLVVASGTLVSNLNADKLDGKEGVEFATIITDTTDFIAGSSPGQLPDVLSADQQTIGIRVDAGNESIQINIGGTIFKVAIT